MSERTRQLTLAALIALGLGLAAWPWLPEAGPPPIPGPGEPVTFAEHIAPIVHDRCTKCHRPGQVAPFSLITYEDVQGRADTIQAVVLERFMPPWPPAASGPPLRHDRSLTEAQIALIDRWVDEGCPLGDPSRVPAPPEFPDDWAIGEPDLVVAMSGEFAIPADGPDVYRSLVFPVGLDEDRWVRAVELRPKARRELHHANFLLDTSGRARREDGQGGVAGIEWMGFQPAGGLGGYDPGAISEPMPDGVAWFMPKGADIVMQSHFHPSGKPAVEQAELALYFTSEPAERAILPIAVPANTGKELGIDIPAGDKNYTVVDSLTLPIAVDAVGVGGHAHYICREMEMTARFPDGRLESLLYIPDWDLNWQGFYFYEEPQRLPAGTVLTTTLIYDNSASNPRNPFDPPRRTTWGRESTDEMGTVMLLTLPDDEADLLHLAREAGDYVIHGFVSAQVGQAVRDCVLPSGRGPGVGRRFVDVDGRAHYPFKKREGNAAVALVFVRPDCPISNYYQPTLSRLHDAYGERGVPFFIVHTDPATTAAEARQHAEDYAIAAPVVLDPDQALPRHFGASITPEVVVIDRVAGVLYAGRIDDTYTGFGKKRAAPTRHDLRDALEAVLAGQPVKTPRTQAVGCFISFKDEAGEGAR